MRLRLTFAKRGALRYIGHLDLQALLERTTRRAGLPLAYTQGFHPGPKIQIAAALPLGFIGQAEIVDLWLDEADPGAGSDRLQEMQARLQAASPPGLIIRSAQAVAEHGPALQTQVSSAAYEVLLLEAEDLPALQARITALLEAQQLPRQRRGRDYDLRPLIEALTLDASSGAPRLHMLLSARAGATGRPEEVLDSLGIPPEAARVERARLILQEAVK